MTLERFVNPFTFVRTPPPRENHPPTFHDGRAPDTYSGVLNVTWTLESPLLLPASASEEGWVTPTNMIAVPGSSVAGSVRSLHEALFNGCFRVVDTTYLPSYREAAKTDSDLRLAIVTDETGTSPREVQLCDDVVWIDSGALLRRWPQRDRLPTSGDLITIQASTRETSLGRTEFENVGTVTLHRASDTRSSPDAAAVGKRVLLITSTSARKATRLVNGQRQNARALWATGVLTDQRIQIDPQEDAKALAAFRAACDGTDDRRRFEQRGNADVPKDWRTRTTFTDVTWWGPRGERNARVGRRANATGQLFRGDVVWVRLQEGRVAEIKLAQIWRKPGQGTVGDRLPAHAHPCLPGENPRLCLTCATFGAADTVGGRDSQSAYAGHVRFGAARSQGPVPLESVRIAPLGQPRPGNGMFYLTWRDDRLAQRSKGDVATHWGSEAEQRNHDIAGRKFYWHSDPDDQAQTLSKHLGRTVGPRYLPTEQHSRGKMARDARLVPAGTRLTSSITFDQLDALAVHTLLSALEPGRVLGLMPGNQGKRFASHLGGGKPFGFGSVTATIESAHITKAANRYAAPAATDGTDWLAARFPAAEVAARVGRFTANLPALSAVLDLDGLGDQRHLVSYPPGSSWDDYQHPTREKANAFGQSYDWFGNVNGLQLASGSNAWAPLPRPEASPILPVRPRRR